VFVHESSADAFVARLSAAVATIKLGTPWDRDAGAHSVALWIAGMGAGGWRMGSARCMCRGPR